MATLPNWIRGILAPALLIALLVLALICTPQDEFPASTAEPADTQTVSPPDLAGDAILMDAASIDSAPALDTVAIIHPLIDPSDKIHPILQRWIADGPPLVADGQTFAPEDTTQEIVFDTTLIIIFTDTLSLPRLPSFRPTESRFSEQNEQILAQRSIIMDTLTTQRALRYRSIEDSLGAAFDNQVEVLERFVGFPAFVVRMPLSLVSAMASRPYVVAIEPQFQDVEPPAYATADASTFTVKDGRRRIGSDPYLSLDERFIGLMDYGLCDRPKVDLRFDCLVGTAAPADFEVCTMISDPNRCGACNSNHGALSGAIVNAQLNDTNHGVTDITLDSYQVYKERRLSHTDGTESCRVRPDGAAMLRSFDTAWFYGDNVILAEIQTSPASITVWSERVDEAFDAGAVIVATNGNNSHRGEGSVNSPARAHKAIGAGAFDIDRCTLSDCPTHPSQSLGLTEDDRIKPDVQAPTRTFVVPPSNPAGATTYSGTSGAAPYVAGAAALLYNRIIQVQPNIEPGHVNAALILSGQDPAIQTPKERGAGMLRLPPFSGALAVFKVTVPAEQSRTITLNLNNAPDTVDVAIWWPEERYTVGTDLRPREQPHHNIDLVVRDPNGTEKWSEQRTSVFERVRVTADATSNPLPSGVWTINTHSADHHRNPRTVYVAVYVASSATAPT